VSFDLSIGANDHPIYKRVHEMEAVKAHHWPSVAFYLFVCADVVWPNDPDRVLRERISTILMQYSETLGEQVENYPAHIVQEDMESVLPAFLGFVLRNRGQ